MLPADAASAGVRGSGVNAADRLRETTRRDPEAQPAVPQLSRPRERRVGPASHQNRDGHRRRRADGAVDLEEPPAKVDLVARQEPAHAAQALGRPSAPLPRVDPAQHDTRWRSSPPTPTPKVNLPGELRDRGQLTRDGRRVTQGKQVDARLHPDVRIGGEKRSCLDQAIRAVAVGEADVVAHRQVIDTRARRSAPRARAAGPTMRRGRARAGRSPPQRGCRRWSPPRDLRGGCALSGGRHGGLQSEYQRTCEASGVRALKDPAGVCAGGEQAGDHVP